MPKRLRLITFAETFRMICGAYPMYARSPSPSQRPAPTTIVSRSPFPLGLCYCLGSCKKVEFFWSKGQRSNLLIELQGSNGMRSNFIVFVVWLGRFAPLATLRHGHMARRSASLRSCIRGTRGM